MLGLNVTVLSAGIGLTVRPVVLLTPESEAVNTMAVEAVTLPPFTENVAEVEPCGTVTVEGTGTAVVFELPIDTTAPDEPAEPVSATVTVAVCPLEIVPGATVIPLKPAATGLMVKPNESLTPR